MAAVCAVLTMFFVPPDAAYIGYIDFHVLCLLLFGGADFLIPAMLLITLLLCLYTGRREATA